MARNQKFEDALKRLETIVSEMENGDLDLEKALSLFEEGTRLVHFCSSKLNETKKKIEILVAKNDTMVAEPFKAAPKSGESGQE